MSLRVGIDIGGTFTDITVSRDDAPVFLWKEDTTPGNWEIAIKNGLVAVAKELGKDLREFLSEVSLFVHGSTIATNAIIQRNGPKVGLICTEGFRDALYFRDAFKWDRYNIRLPRPDDLIPRYLRVGVTERINSKGGINVPLDADSVREAAIFFRDQKVEAVAVSLLWSHINPTHEHQIKAILAEHTPEIPVLLSSDILPEIGEWVRTSASALSAYAYPPVATYLRALEAWLIESGLKCGLLVMQINGGCASVEQTLSAPISTIASGPAAAPAAARQVSQRIENSNAPDLIIADMGGTSLDVCLMVAGEVPRSRDIMVEHQPIGVPGVEVHSIGAGGGSIGWIDAGGVLRIGPQSAGAAPGPAAYGRGGTSPTVTDANIVLGYLSTEAFLGGRGSLNSELAEQAISEKLAKPLGITTVEAAAGIIRIVNENMVNAIREMSVERGIDPRPFVLVAGGGAGALHAGRLAAELGIERVLIPAEAGTLSAFGMTVTDIRHDYSGTLHTASAAPAIDDVKALIGKLESRARVDLGNSGIDDAETAFQRFVDARYVGQVHEIIIPVPDGEMDEEAFKVLRARFDEAHEARYTYSLPESTVEYLHWRVTGVGLIERPAEVGFPEKDHAPADAARIGSRPAYFAEFEGFTDTPVYDAEKFPAGGEVSGPAIVDSATTTIVVFPGQRLIADGQGSFVILTNGGTDHRSTRPSLDVKTVASSGR